MSTLGEKQKVEPVAKGDAPAPAELVVDVFAPDLSLRTSHHILFLLQHRAEQFHRTPFRRPKVRAHGQAVIRRSSVVG